MMPLPGRSSEDSSATSSSKSSSFESIIKNKGKLPLPPKESASEPPNAANADVASIREQEKLGAPKEKSSWTDKLKNKFKAVKKEGMNALDNKVIQIQWGLSKGVKELKGEKKPLNSPLSNPASSQMRETVKNSSNLLEVPPSTARMQEPVKTQPERVQDWPQRPGSPERPYITFVKEDPKGQKFVAELTQGIQNNIVSTPLTDRPGAPKVPHQYFLDAGRTKEFTLNGEVLFSLEDQGDRKKKLEENYAALEQLVGKKNAYHIASLLVQSTLSGDRFQTIQNIFRESPGHWGCNGTGLKIAVDVKDGNVQITYKIAYQAGVSPRTEEGYPSPGTILFKRVITIPLAELDRIELPPEGKATPERTADNPFTDARVEDSISAFIKSEDAQRLLKDF